MGNDVSNRKQGRVDFNGEPVNEALKEHSIKTQDWNFKEAATLLHEWAIRFNEEFKLDLPTPAIRLDQITRCRYGQYQPGRNGFGLKHETAINVRYTDGPFAEVLSTLLHEQIHCWQSLYGRPGKNNYHNIAFRNKAGVYGLVIDERGYTLGIERGRLTELLSQHGIDTFKLSMPGERQKVRPRGNSKMRKWRCACTNVRCATRFAAHCDICGAAFKEALAAW